TLVELLVIVAVIFILGAMILPQLANPPHRTPASLTRCISNLKQIDMVTLMYSQDYNGRLPWQQLRTNDSAANTEFASSQFKILSDYYKHLPQLLACPADKAKIGNTNLETLTDQNISYFLNIDAPFTNHPANTFFSGDRNLWVGTFKGN